MKYTYDKKYAAHYGDTTVTVPDQVASDQRGFAGLDNSFPAIRRNGQKVRVRIDAEATGLWTPGTGDLRVKAERRGGRRAGAGRKAEDGAEGTARYNVALDEETVKKARKLGNGNLSLGIRKAVDAA
jgi:hypothetical protein